MSSCVRHCRVRLRTWFTNVACMNAQRDEDEKPEVEDERSGKKVLTRFGHANEKDSVCE